MVSSFIPRDCPSSYLAKGAPWTGHIVCQSDQSTSTQPLRIAPMFAKETAASLQAWQIIHIVIVQGSELLG
jgi:hypothetical protein